MCKKKIKKEECIRTTRARYMQSTFDGYSPNLSTKEEYSTYKEYKEYYVD